MRRIRPDPWLGNRWDRASGRRDHEHRPAHEARTGLATWIRRAGYPRSGPERLLDRGESVVLGDQRVDLRILVIQCEREAGGLAPDALVLRSGEPDRIGAQGVSAFA